MERWVVERSFRWVNRFRSLAHHYERLPEPMPRPYQKILNTF
nr:transposase [Xanthomonas dyei]